jgi:ATP-dependent helicase STH1/SNF2
MFARARFKLGMDEKVIQAGRFDNKSTAEDSEEMLRAILEADNEVEENEESGILNDDEINEIIARSDDEVRIFREMDVERERAADEAWRAKGNRGPRPASLIQVEELPSYWQTEDVYESAQEEDRFEGRGARKRQQVNYSEGLTDEQLAQVRFPKLHDECR